MHQLWLTCKEPNKFFKHILAGRIGQTLWLVLQAAVWAAPVADDSLRISFRPHLRRVLSHVFCTYSVWQFLVLVILLCM